MALEALGPAVPSEELLERVVRAVVEDDRAEVLDAAVHPVAYASASPATGGLHRVRGVARTGVGGLVRWSVFVKTLHHVSLSPIFTLLPPEQAAHFAAEFPWRWETDQYGREVDRMPAGLCVPVIHAVDEPDDLHCVLWMEDVEQSATPWRVRRYAAAARALGRYAASHRLDQLPEPSPFAPGYALRMYVMGQVRSRLLPYLHDDAVWDGAPLAGVVDAALRADLLRLAEAVDRWLDRLDALPQTLAHGDASPQNLLVPPADDGFVVIDWGFGSPLAVGFDLGQLLVGLVQAGEADAAELAAAHDAILPAYVEGLRDEGMSVPEDVVRFGYVASLVLRSAFSGVPWERLGEPHTEALLQTFRQRALMTRFVVDLGLAELRRDGTDVPLPV